MGITLVAVDVGASRTRVHVGGDPTAFVRAGGALIREVRSASVLKELLAEVRDEVGGDGPVHLVAGVAGPSSGEGVREMTNWPSDRVVAAEALRALGYDRVLLLNDLEAAAHGLVALLRGDPGRDVLVPFGGAALPPSGNRALVMPGSGLGAAGIVDLGPGRDPRWHVVPSEAGHTLAVSFESDDVLASLARGKGGAPTWEDCVSGPGLEALWVAMGSTLRDDPLSAPEIAMRAATGDARCREALDHYYRFAAGFSQVLVLSILSTGGLFLAGGSTGSNAPLISEDGFLSAFRDNPRMEGVLRRIPVFLVLAEINLLGAWTEGWRRAGQRP